MVSNAKLNRWRKNWRRIYLLMKGPLTDWEREFIKRAWQRNWDLPPKMEAVVNRMWAKYFREP